MTTRPAATPSFGILRSPPTVARKATSRCGRKRKNTSVTCATRPSTQEPRAARRRYCALVDAYNRCIEERRRAEDLLKLHERWSERPVGGVVEPEPVIVPKVQE